MCSRQDLLGFLRRKSQPGGIRPGKRSVRVASVVRRIASVSQGRHFQDVGARPWGGDDARLVQDGYARAQC